MELTRKVFWQSFFYVAAFYVTLPFVLLSYYVKFMGGSSFWMFAVAAVMAPGQGLMNAIIYFQRTKNATGEAFASLVMGYTRRLSASVAGVFKRKPQRSKTQNSISELDNKKKKKEESVHENMIVPPACTVPETPPDGCILPNDRHSRRRSSLEDIISGENTSALVTLEEHRVSGGPHEREQPHHRQQTTQPTSMTRSDKEWSENSDDEGKEEIDDEFFLEGEDGSNDGLEVSDRYSMDNLDVSDAKSIQQFEGTMEYWRLNYVEEVSGNYTQPPNTADDIAAAQRTTYRRFTTYTTQELSDTPSNFLRRNNRSVTSNDSACYSNDSTRPRRKRARNSSPGPFQNWTFGLGSNDSRSSGEAPSLLRAIANRLPARNSHYSNDSVDTGGRSAKSTPLPFFSTKKGRRRQGRRTSTDKATLKLKGLPGRTSLHSMESYDTRRSVRTAPVVTVEHKKRRDRRSSDRTVKVSSWLRDDPDAALISEEQECSPLSESTRAEDEQNGGQRRKMGSGTDSASSAGDGSHVSQQQRLANIPSPNLIDLDASPQITGGIRSGKRLASQIDTKRLAETVMFGQQLEAGDLTPRRSRRRRHSMDGVDKMISADTNALVLTAKAGDPGAVSRRSPRRHSLTEVDGSGKATVKPNGTVHQDFFSKHNPISAPTLVPAQPSGQSSAQVHSAARPSVPIPSTLPLSLPLHVPVPVATATPALSPAGKRRARRQSMDGDETKRPNVPFQRGLDDNGLVSLSTKSPKAFTGSAIAPSNRDRSHFAQNYKVDTSRPTGDAGATSGTTVSETNNSSAIVKSNGMMTASPRVHPSLSQYTVVTNATNVNNAENLHISMLSPPKSTSSLPMPLSIPLSTLPIPAPLSARKSSNGELVVPYPSQQQEEQQEEEAEKIPQEQQQQRRRRSSKSHPQLPLDIPMALAMRPPMSTSGPTVSLPSPARLGVPIPKTTPLPLPLPIAIPDPHQRRSEDLPVNPPTNPSTVPSMKLTKTDSATKTKLPSRRFPQPRPRLSLASSRRPPARPAMTGLMTRRPPVNGTAAEMQEGTTPDRPSLHQFSLNEPSGRPSLAVTKADPLKPPNSHSSLASSNVKSILKVQSDSTDRTTPTLSEHLEGIGKTGANPVALNTYPIPIFAPSYPQATTSRKSKQRVVAKAPKTASRPSVSERLRGSPQASPVGIPQDLMDTTGNPQRGQDDDGLFSLVSRSMRRIPEDSAMISPNRARPVRSADGSPGWDRIVTEPMRSFTSESPLPFISDSYPQGTVPATKTTKQKSRSSTKTGARTKGKPRPRSKTPPGARPPKKPATARTTIPAKPIRPPGLPLVVEDAPHSVNDSTLSSSGRGLRQADTFSTDGESIGRGRKPTQSIPANTETSGTPSKSTKDSLSPDRRARRPSLGETRSRSSSDNASSTGLSSENPTETDLEKKNNRPFFNRFGWGKQGRKSVLLTRSSLNYSDIDMQESSMFSSTHEDVDYDDVASASASSSNGASSYDFDYDASYLPVFDNLDNSVEE